jgi:hypothetical protein
MLKINKTVCPLSLTPHFIQILQREIGKHSAKTSDKDTEGLTLNFRDPNYSAESGGYHPVEISLTGQGVLLYVTDFSFVGQYSELAKELDFDFGMSLFGHMGRNFPITEGAELFILFQHNFCDYYHQGVFAISVHEN